MAERKRIGLREINALGPREEIWDSTVRGFGARRRAGAAVSYVLMYRTAEGRLRRYTIGPHGAPWKPKIRSPPRQRLLGEVADGRDPGAEKRGARRLLTVSELLDRYWKDARAASCWPAAAVEDTEHARLRQRADRRARPTAARPPPGRRGYRHDIEKMMQSIAVGKTVRKAKPQRSAGSRSSAAAAAWQRARSASSAPSSHTQSAPAPDLTIPLTGSENLRNRDASGASPMEGPGLLGKHCGRRKAPHSGRRRSPPPVPGADRLAPRGGAQSALARSRPRSPDGSTRRDKDWPQPPAAPGGRLRHTAPRSARRGERARLPGQSRGGNDGGLPQPMGEDLADRCSPMSRRTPSATPSRASQRTLATGTPRSRASSAISAGASLRGTSTPRTLCCSPPLTRSPLAC